MTEKENSAFRLYRFFQKMTQQPPNMPTIQAVFNAFGEEAKDSRTQISVLARATSLVDAEMRSLIEESRAIYSDETRQPILTAFERGFSVGGLQQGWNQVLPAFQSTLVPLRIFGEALPTEGDPIVKEDLTDLQASVKALREEIVSSTLPPYVKRFILEQLDTIAGAIRDYPLAGVKAFKVAAAVVTLRQMDQANIVQEVEKTEQYGKLKTILIRVGDFIKSSRISKLLVSGETLGKSPDMTMQVAAQITEVEAHLQRSGEEAE